MTGPATGPYAQARRRRSFAASSPGTAASACRPLAASLDNLAKQLRAIGLQAEAAVPGEEAAKLRRRLA